MIRGVMAKLVKANGAKDAVTALDINDTSAIAFLWKYLGMILSLNSSNLQT